MAGTGKSWKRPEGVKFRGLNDSYAPFSLFNAKSIFNLANTYLMKDKATQLFKESLFESARAAVIQIK